MGIHFPKNMVGRCKQAKLTPVSIGIGADVHWQGGVDTSMMMRILALQQECEQKFPVSDLPPAKERKPKAESSSTTPRTTPADTPAVPSTPAAAPKQAAPKSK